jgi:hypothetical protein
MNVMITMAVVKKNAKIKTDLSNVCVMKGTNSAWIIFRVLIETNVKRIMVNVKKHASILMERTFAIANRHDF